MGDRWRSLGLYSGAEVHGGWRIILKWTLLSRSGGSGTVCCEKGPRGCRWIGLEAGGSACRWGYRQRQLRQVLFLERVAC